MTIPAEWGQRFCGNERAAFEPASLAMPIVLLSAQLYLAWAYRETFAGVLSVHAEPNTPRVAVPRHLAST